MSTYWGYRCKTHDSTPGHGLNHGEDTLVEIWRVRRALIEIRKIPCVTTDVIGCWDDSIGDWVEDHADCDVVLENEYLETRVMSK